MADKAYFLSDIHLGSVKEPNSFLLLKFLMQFHSTEQITHLFLLGDIFDLWISNHHYFKTKYSVVIDELQRLKGLGVEIHYFEGNHDLYLNDYFGRELGFHIHSGPQYFQLCGLTVRVEHGDQMDPSDTGYIFLRWLLRTPVMKWLAPRLPSSFVVWLGERMSRASRKYTSDIKVISKDKTQRVIQEHAAKVFKEKPFHYLIAGHVHLVFEHAEKSYTAINLGTWLEQPRVYIFSSDFKGYAPSI